MYFTPTPATLAQWHRQSWTAATLYIKNLYVLLNLMNENQAKKARKKTAWAYLILTAAFVVIFGGITLMGIFIAHLS